MQAQRLDTDRPWNGMTAEMTLPADGSQVRLARVVAANIAIRHEFDVDGVADLELLVDGACSLLAPIAAPDTVLRCRFIWSDEAITVDVSAVPRPDADVDFGSTDWYVLKTVADRVHSWQVGEGADHARHIELTLGKNTG
jgi:serine/threonine-protein kinase RsbW